jgi:hypothetical protein
MNFMICSASHRVKDKKRNLFHSGAPSLNRVNDNSLKIPMIPVDVNRKK